MKAKKYDIGKTRWDKVPFDILEGLAKVTTYGANKYKENPDILNWKKVEDGYNRYFSALMRHLIADRKGEYLDKESGLPHMSHAMFNVVCLAYFSEKNNGDKIGNNT